MPTKAVAPQQEQQNVAAGEISPLPARTMDLFRAMAAGIELVTDNSGADMVEEVLQAQSWQDLAETGLADTEDLLGLDMVVTGLKFRWSDYRDSPLGVYAVINAHPYPAGSPFRFTTGSTDVIVRLVKLHHLGALPARVVLARSERPTKAGYYPLGLRVLQAMVVDGGAGDGADADL